MCFLVFATQGQGFPALEVFGAPVFLALPGLTSQSHCFDHNSEVNEALKQFHLIQKAKFSHRIISILLILNTLGQLFIW